MMVMHHVNHVRYIVATPHCAICSVLFFNSICVIIPINSQVQLHISQVVISVLYVNLDSRRHVQEWLSVSHAPMELMLIVLVCFLSFLSNRIAYLSVFVMTDHIGYSYDVCASCPAGTSSSQSTTGTASCTRCGAGYFSYYNSAACTLCPIGSASNQTGTQLCSYCSAGTYSDTPGSRLCNFCAPGTYQSYAGSSTCFQCPPGSFIVLFVALPLLDCHLLM
jgi:hypothetical protein